MASIGTKIYHAAEMYTSVVETGAGLAYNIAEGSISCIEAACRTTAGGLRRGLSTGLKKCVSHSLGFRDYHKAIVAFRKKPPISIPNAPGSLVIDMRTDGERVGEFTGHMINGLCKAVTTGVIAFAGAAVVAGAISNYQWPNLPDSNFGPFHSASRHIAKGFGELAKCMAQAGWAVGAALGNGTFAMGKVAASNPKFTLKFAGVGGLGYLTCRQIVNVGKVESYTRKTYHVALATIGIGAMACVTLC